MSELPPPLRIGIVGGGIGGLVAALGILRAQKAGANVRVDIYETGPTFSELGAGLSFGSNAIRCFNLMGLREEFEKAAGPEGSDGNLWYELEMGEKDMPESGKCFGRVVGPERIEAVHRADFLDLLVDLLPDGISHFDHRCTSYTPHEGGVTIQFTARDGSESSAECDILLGADGIKSSIRRTLLARTGLDPAEGEATYQKWTVWRGMIDAKEFARACPGVGTKTTYFGRGRHIVTFPVRKGELINFVGYVWDEDEKELEGRSGPWSEILPIEKALEDFKGFSDKCLSIIKDAFFISNIITNAYVTDSSIEARGGRIQKALEVYRDARHARGLDIVSSSMRTGRILDLSGLRGEGTDTEKITKELQSSLDKVWRYDTAGELVRALERLRA
ncbi:hypothetical protein RQP46_004509 [Phenoliferia psychrophenolica]